MNIEKIKERASLDYYYDTSAIVDIRYLLSIIEQAEKALELVCTDPHTHRPARDFAFQAFQAIRGSE